MSGPIRRNTWQCCYRRGKIAADDSEIHSRKKSGPVPFAVAAPTDDISKKPVVFVLEGGVGATSSKTAARHGTGVTQKAVTT